MRTHATLHIWTWKADYQIKSLQICSVPLRSVRPALKNDTRETHSYEEHKWRDEANKGRASGKSQVLGITDLLQVFHIFLILTYWSYCYSGFSRSCMCRNLWIRWYQKSAKLEATVFFGAKCPVFAKVKAGRTDFKEKVLERAKNRKGGTNWCGKVGRNQDESSFFFTYIHGLTMFDVENMLQNMTTCCPTIIQYRLMPRDLTYLRQRSELMSSKNAQFFLYVWRYIAMTIRCCHFHVCQHSP